VDEEQFEAVKRWGEGLQGSDREELGAAGTAIVLLCAEIDRLERELWNVKTAETYVRADGDVMAEVSTAGEEDSVEGTLRARMRGFVSGLHSRPAKR
jgi:hypothetical protein